MRFSLYVCKALAKTLAKALAKALETCKEKRVCVDRISCSYHFRPAIMYVRTYVRTYVHTYVRACVRTYVRTIVNIVVCGLGGQLENLTDPSGNAIPNEVTLDETWRDNTRRHEKR